MNDQEIEQLIAGANAADINAIAGVLCGAWAAHYGLFPEAPDDRRASLNCLKLATVEIVRAAAERKVPTPPTLVGLTMWALALPGTTPAIPQKRGRGNPGKADDRAWAALQDAVFQTRGKRQSTRRLAAIVNCSPTAVRKWRADPAYKALVETWIGRAAP